MIWGILKLCTIIINKVHVHFIIAFCQPAAQAPAYNPWIGWTCNVSFQ
jgi:hypothetical protein